MKQSPNESYEDWVERVRAYELDQALKEIKKGADINVVMEAMSARMIKKMLHPVILAIKDSHKSEFNVEEHRASYFSTMGNRGPVADHVDGQIFDKNQ